MVDKQKEGLGEFFKFSWIKIIISIIILIILFILPITPLYIVLKCEGCSGVKYSTLFALNYGGGSVIWLTWMFIIGEIIISYIISCLIIFIHNKIRSEK